ncbi:MAG TPA: purine-nucleoside phosphorylase [Verrucomicrobia bacterium]|nr:purine-nucleoside phosphorylase [Verrucomicrobiota bacterium]
MDIGLLESAFVHVRRALGIDRVDAAVILGSGWSDTADAFEPVAELTYADIPGFGATGVVGHKGRLLLARASQRHVLIFQGRRHGYEGGGWEPIALPVYIAVRAAARAVFLTNAAGGINPDFQPGDLMLVTDHINMTGSNPLVGPHHPIWGERFPDQSHLYSPALAAQLRQSALHCSQPLREGVYLATSGPCYETPAEIRMFRHLGADAVGMSTVPEAILAGAAGLQVAAVSCITNPAAGVVAGKLEHTAVLAATRQSMPAMTALLHHGVCHADY